LISKHASLWLFGSRLRSLFVVSGGRYLFGSNEDFPISHILPQPSRERILNRFSGRKRRDTDTQWRRCRHRRRSAREDGRGLFIARHVHWPDVDWWSGLFTWFGGRWEVGNLPCTGDFSSRVRLTATHQRSGSCLGSPSFRCRL